MCSRSDHLGWVAMALSIVGLASCGVGSPFNIAPMSG